MGEPTEPSMTQMGSIATTRGDSPKRRRRAPARGTDRVHFVKVLGSSELLPVSGARNRKIAAIAQALVWGDAHQAAY
jgi:hypothetical protein